MTVVREVTPEQQQSRRRIYLRQRIPALREEFQKVVQETQEISAQIKGEVAPPHSPEGKRVRERLIYLREHGDWIRSHLKELTQEKQQLTPGKAAAANEAEAAAPPGKKSAKR